MYWAVGYVDVTNFGNVGHRRSRQPKPFTEVTRKLVLFFFFYLLSCIVLIYQQKETGVFLLAAPVFFYFGVTTFTKLRMVTMTRFERGRFARVGRRLIAFSASVGVHKKRNRCA